MIFLEALKKRRSEGLIPVIPDIKCFSPKDGDLMRGRDPVEIAKTLENAGACVLSVVTEEREFRGSMELLRAVCAAVRVPVLRKDFIETVRDLEETKEAGAAAILLMYSCLGKEKLESLYREALRMGLLPFVETHTGEELSYAEQLGAPLTGINNRNILLLERDGGDVSHAAGLLTGLRDHLRGRDAAEDPACAEPFIVVESGLHYDALEDFADVQESLKELEVYYGSKEWKKDFSDDEKGLLPPDLKRGVLSEDGIWNLLEEARALKDRMLEYSKVNI